jgi:predicted esterase
VANPHLAQPIIELGAPLDRAHVAVVLVHGRAQTPEFMRSHVVDGLRRDDVAFWLPHAAGDSWYPESLLAPLEDNHPWLAQALDALGIVVRTVLERGFHRHRLVLAGFSQGGCVVAEYALRHPGRYGGVVACTAGLTGPPGTRWPEAGRAGGPGRAGAGFGGTPVLFTTAEDDSWAPVWRVTESADVFARMGASVRSRVYPGGEHTVRPEEVREIDAILSRAATDPDPV